MSIHFPFVNAEKNTSGSLPVHLLMPNTAGTKAANTAVVFGFWTRTPSVQFLQTRNHALCGRANGANGGNDGSIMLDQPCTTLSVNFRGSPSALINGSVTAPGKDKVFLVMLIGTSTNSHLVLCEPGGTPQVFSSGANVMYTKDCTTEPFIKRLGATISGFYGPIGEAFMCLGEFPKSAGVPDATLIQNIANGTLDLDTLDTQLTGGVKKFRYRLRNRSDLSDSWGIAGAMTIVNGNEANGRLFYSGGQLRPTAMKPNRSRNAISQVAFDAPLVNPHGVIKTEGGIYSGITPFAIQARLVRENGITLVDWVTVDASPSGGTWVAGQITNVPMVAGFSRLEFRAIDGIGAQIGETVVSNGLRGVGFALLGQGQSQLMHQFNVGAGLAIPNNINLMTLVEAGTTNANTQEFILSSDLSNNAIVYRGVRQAAIEINKIFPGVPIQLMTFGTSGTNLLEYGTGGVYENRPQYIANHFGIPQDFILFQYGHSAVSGNEVNYEAAIDDVVSHVETALGTITRVVQCPTARYSLAASGGNFTFISTARNGARNWVKNNQPKGFWGGSWSIVGTGESAVSSDPHPSDDDKGHGRSGALWAWASMMAAGALPIKPVGIKTATPVGTSVILKFGLVKDTGTLPVGDTGTSVAAAQIGAGVGIVTYGGTGTSVAAAQTSAGVGIVIYGGTGASMAAAQTGAGAGSQSQINGGTSVAAAQTGAGAGSQSQINGGTSVAAAQTSAGVGIVIYGGTGASMAAAQFARGQNALLVTPDERIAIVLAEDRTINVASELRTVYVIE